MNLIPHLDALDALLSDEGRWTQDYFARDAHGEPCRVDSVDARCWCLSGAVQRVLNLSKPSRDTWRLLAALVGALEESLPPLPPRTVVTWQDDPERKFSDVKSLIHRTRTRLAAEGRA